MGGLIPEIKVALKLLSSIDGSLKQIAKSLEERNNADPDVTSYRFLKQHNYFSEGDDE